MIALDHVSYRYPGTSADAITDVTWTCTPGFHLLMGPNGSGKTTLLKLMSTLRLPVSGVCRINDADSRLRLPSSLCTLWLVTDEMLLPGRSLNSLVKCHAPFYPNFDREILEDGIATFGIDPKRDLAKMSLGTRKKALLSYGASLRVSTLLLDEPTNGLDMNSRDQLRMFLARHIADDASVVVATHIPGDLMPLFDTLTMLSHGRIALQAEVSDIISSLSFVSGAAPAADALYSTQRLGLWRSIIPADRTGRPTAIDVPLLYDAIQHPEAASTINRLIQTDKL